MFCRETPSPPLLLAKHLRPYVGKHLSDPFSIEASGTVRDILLIWACTDGLIATDNDS